jgi:hypothetical protein
MAERNNRNVRHLAYRDAQIGRQENLRTKVDFHEVKGGPKAKRHGWPLPQPESHQGETGS